MNQSAIDPMILEARTKGFLIGARVMYQNQIRTMTSNRLDIDSKGNIFTGGAHPFFIFFMGKWKAKVIKGKS